MWEFNSGVYWKTHGPAVEKPAISSRSQNNFFGALKNEKWKSGSGKQK